MKDGDEDEDEDQRMKSFFVESLHLVGINLSIVRNWCQPRQYCFQELSKDQSLESGRRPP
jgi:hypothetical protein